MGLLDDLEQQAQERKRAESEAARAKEDKGQVYKTTLEPALQALHDYLKRLTASLTELKPERIQRYEVPGYGVISATVVHVYRLSITQPNLPQREVKLDYEAQILTEQCADVELQGSAKIKTVIALFQKHRIGNQHPNQGGDAAVQKIRPRGKVPICARFLAESTTGVVKMQFSNVESLGEVSKVVPAAAFDQELFDAVGRFLAREDNELFKENLPEKYRQSLRQKVQQDLMKRKWEEKIVQQQRDEAARVAEEHSFKAKLGKSADSILGKLENVPGLGALVKRFRRDKDE